MKFIAFVIFLVLATFTVNASTGLCSNSNPERMEDEDSFEAFQPDPPFFNCATPNIDAAVLTSDKKTYFFKGHYYWRILTNGDVAAGYPRLTTQDWVGLPGNLDAAFTWKNGKTYFFKDTKYWRFENNIMDPGYPREIREGFCGIPDRVDAALLWGPNELTYFIKGGSYWRFDGGEAEVPVKSGYPMSMSEWQGIPTNVDAAFQWKNGRSYFFKGDKYYRYDDYGNDSGAGKPIAISDNWGVTCEELRARIPRFTGDPRSNNAENTPA